MPGRIPQIYGPRQTVDASPAAAAETVIATYTGISTVDADSIVLLFAQCNITIGTSGTALRLRVRQMSLTGTVIGDTGALTGGIAATNLVSQDVIGVDRPGAVASFIYVLTAQITGGAAVSTVSAVIIAPMVA